MYSEEPFPLVHCSHIGDPPGVSPVTETVFCSIPCCSYSWTVLCTPQRDNSVAGDKPLVALGFPELEPPHVLHSCLSLPTGAITVWKWHTAPSPHTCRKRPCVSTGQPWFAHKQNTDFFAGPSFERCTCTVTCPLDSIWLTEFNTICCMLPLYGHCNYSTHITALNAVVSVHSAHG